MLLNNDFITYVNADAEVDFTSGKGHLFYWIYVFSGWALGFSDFSMRLPSAIFGFLCIICSFLFVEKRCNYKFAFISSSIMLLTQQFLHHRRSVHPDGSFAVLFAFARFSFYSAIGDDKNEGNPLFYYLFGLSVAAAVCVRQAVGFFILPTAFIYALSVPQRKKIIFNKHLWLSLILAALLTAPWYLAAYNKWGDKFLIEFLSTPYKVLTGIQLDVSPFDDSGRGTYFSILLANYEPWLIFLIIGTAAAVKSIKREGLLFKNSLTKFFLFWAYVPFIMFLLMSGHKYYFLLPIYIPFAFLSTLGLFEVFKDKNKDRIIAYLLIILFLLSSLCFLVKLFPKTLDNQHYVNTIHILPQMNAIGDEGNVIYTLDRAKYYNALLMFYRDKPNVKHIEPEEFEKMFYQDERYYFVVYKRTFDELTIRDAQILGETKEDVLFTNGGKEI
jgi:4-amino-4-deoxy-L-arabinose transferase-like glycosyltransferase